MKCLLAVVIASLLMTLLPAFAQGPDDQYVQIYNLIQEADAMEAKGQVNQSLAKFLEAQTALRRFQRGYPEWNPQVIKFRLSYIEDKIAARSTKATEPSGVATTSAQAPVTAQPGRTSPPADADNQLGALNEQIRQLQTDKTVLEAKLKEALAAQPAAMDPREFTKAEERIKSLQKENDLLKVAINQSKTKTPKVSTNQASNSEAETVAALHVENEMLKKQLANLKNSLPGPAKTQETVPLTAPAPTQIATLQSEKETLRLEKIALEDRIKQMNSAAAPAPATSVAQVPVRPPNEADAARIKQLERERADLQKKLDAALKDAYGKKGKTVGTRIEEMDNQMAALRARLEIFEARAIPYNPEELALLKKPEPRLAEVDPKAKKKSMKEMPAGSAALVAEAQRYFAEKKLDKAEEKYLQVLHQDEKNVFTLANLAAIQLELGRLDEAEKHINQAVTLAPTDAYSLAIQGYLRFKQQKYDEALDALSRAAKSEPENAEIQNYLGLTLSQKGMRGPAETALRKAIQIDPAYGSAHNNLAVVYLAQQPASVELAKWHYQKALAAGHPRNPELEKMLDTKKLAEKGQ